MKLPESVSRATALGDVSRERDRQERIHGAASLIHGDAAALVGLPILVEELGEVGRAILERDPEKYRTELVHVAAVAVAMIQAHDAKAAEVGA